MRKHQGENHVFSTWMKVEWCQYHSFTSLYAELLTVVTILWMLDK